MLGDLDRQVAKFQLTASRFQRPSVGQQNAPVKFQTWPRGPKSFRWSRFLCMNSCQAGDSEDGKNLANHFDRIP